MGWHRGGHLVRVLPGAALMLAISYVYVYFGTLPWVNAIFYGLKASVLALVASALHSNRYARFKAANFMGYCRGFVWRNFFPPRSFPVHYSRRHRYWPDNQFMGTNCAAGFTGNHVVFPTRVSFTWPNNPDWIHLAHPLAHPAVYLCAAAWPGSRSRPRITLFRRRRQRPW